MISWNSPVENSVQKILSLKISHKKYHMCGYKSHCVSDPAQEGPHARIVKTASAARTRATHATPAQNG